MRHHLAQPPLLPEVRTHRYGLVDFAVLPPGRFPSHTLSVYPMHLESAVRLAVMKKPAFTHKAFLAEIKEVLEALGEFFLRHSRFFTPAQARWIQGQLATISDLTDAGEGPEEILPLARGLVDHWQEAIVGKVSAEEMETFLRETEIRPEARERIFRADEHMSRLLAADFDWYVFMQTHPPKEALSHFLRVKYLAFRVAENILFSVTFTPDPRNRKTWVKGHLVFAPFLFRTIATIQRLGHIGAGAGDPTSGSNYQAVINADIYSTEVVAVLDRAYRNVALSYEIRATTGVPIGYRSREPRRYLSMLELYLSPVYPFRVGVAFTARLLGQFRWNLDLLYRLAYGVRYRPLAGLPDQAEVVGLLDTLYAALQGYHVPDYEPFKAGAIERLMELREFTANIPAYRKRGLDGFLGLL